MPTLPGWVSRQHRVMPGSAAPETIDIAARVARHDMKWPVAAALSGQWFGGAPLGNGDFGAMVSGPPDSLTFLLGKNDLWVRPGEPSTFPRENYAGLLDIYRRRDREAFARLMPGDPNWTDRFMPSTLTQAATLRLHLADTGNLRKLESALSLHDATWRMKFEVHGLDNMWAQDPDFEVEAFASAGYEVLGIRVTRTRLPLRSITWRLGRETHRLLPPAAFATSPWSGEAGAKPGVVTLLEQAMPRGDRYAVAMLQESPAVTTTIARRSVLGEVDSDDAHSMTLWLAAATHRDGESPAAAARERVEAAARAGWDAVHAEHRRHWALFWSRAWVACEDAALERPWYISNYIAGSILRPGKVSPGLQGMWCKENQPPWNADFHGNVNIQAVYQGVMGSNHVELVEPYVSLYHGMIAQCGQDTHDYFGVAGVRFPHAGGIDGQEQTELNWFPLAVSLAPSPWIARVVWWAYLHTLDREFLRDAAYPIIKGVADYVHGLLELAGKGPDGRYLLEPSIWGEWACTAFEAWGTDSSYDIAATWIGLTQAAEAAGALGVDGEAAVKWRAAAALLPDMPVDAQDMWVFWRNHPKPENNHRIAAGSFFHPVFPCEMAGAFNGPERWRRQAAATWRDASAKVCNAWCGGTPVAAAARMGDAEWAYRAASMPMAVNGMGDGATLNILQADHAPGMSLALNSMLVIGVEGLLVLFPAMPARIDIAFHSLRAPGAVLVSGRQQGGVVTHVALQILEGGEVRLLNPYGRERGAAVTVRVVRASDGKIILHADRRFRELMEWRGGAGEVYRVEAEA
ncbi:MAG: glycoside hydrolase family 95 protein [Planctomycetes bacterium]|nr:glycoside hydrolase family 95 protein [Planctomycetota bacterium]